MTATDLARLRDAKDQAAKLLQKNKLEPALAAFQAALALAPHDQALHQKMGETLARLGRRAEAIRAYQRAVGGWAHDGQFLRAIALCKVILQLDPAHHETQAALADLYAKTRGNRPATVPGTLGAELKVKRPVSTEAPPPLPEPITEPELDLELTIDEADIEEAVEVEAMTAPVLPRVPLFSELSTTAFISVLEGLELRHVDPREVIVTEGEKDRTMYAVVQGRVRVLRGDASERKAVAEMDEGTFFGEMAMMTGAPRVATVEAVGKVVLMVFPPERIAAIVKEHPSVARALDKFYRDRLLQNLTRQSPLFSPLSDAQQDALAASFRPRTFTRGETILEQGKPPDGFYVILRGRCRVSDHAGGSYPDLNEGDVFGEISLVTGKPVTASVRAATACTVLRLPAAAFTAQVLGHPQVGAAVRRLGAERLARKAGQVRVTV
ncbi:MAG: cyclic nucleotide-binding domain-containing protein [Deltaproteobacteria bacterium]|nr:cyclic nucleotide-binding domain-containing protein [Deltaproteobacteria bacterium]